MGCNSPKQIDRYYKKMLDADSATVVMEMVVPIFGKVEMIMKLDGNKTYSSAFFDEAEKYTEVIGDTVYTYTQNEFGNWDKSESKVEEDETSADEELEELFNSENYDYSKDLKKFVLKEGATPKIFDDMVARSLTLEIDGDNCIIVGSMNLEGMVMDFSITIKSLNNTTITIPEV
ncbi:MAG: hypothetical protein WC292_07710 [Clostridia bacterium]